jgi:K+-transporting ATPase A subunit
VWTTITLYDTSDVTSMRSTYKQGGGLFENNSAHRAYNQVLAYALTPYSAAPSAMLITFGHALLQSIRSAGHEFTSCRLQRLDGN